MRTITCRDLAHGPVPVADGESFAIDWRGMPRGIELSVWRYSANKQQGYLGVIAQQVQRVRPDVVSLSPTGMLTVNHSKLFGTGFEGPRSGPWQDSLKVQNTLRNALGLKRKANDADH